jgi:pimeloyl-ACP methyl ester carboxylesterase
MRNNHVILLHGALGSSSDHSSFADKLSHEGLHPQLLEFSGHGNQPFSDDFGIKQFSTELKAFIEKKDLKGAAIFGYSMGGFVALYTASIHADLVGPIITLGTKLNWTNENITQESGFCDWNFLLQKAPSFAGSLKTKHADHMLLLQKTATMIKAFENGNLHIPEWQPTQKIVLGLGDRDKLVTIDECREFMKGRKTCGLYMLPNTGHPFDQADQTLLAKVVKRMLEKD